MKKINQATVEQYISHFPTGTQKLLRQLRGAIIKAAPKAEEGFSYGMPAYKLGSPLVYFAGFKNHVGFYAVPSGIAAFKKELENYKTSKGTIQFPLDKPIPVSLVGKIVKFRVAENMQKLAAKKK
jgi:uncharacterized protein YdhG (YjbR/CyaY superfamily)